MRLKWQQKNDRECYSYVFGTPLMCVVYHEDGKFRGEILARDGDAYSASHSFQTEARAKQWCRESLTTWAKAILFG